MYNFLCAIQNIPELWCIAERISVSKPAYIAQRTKLKLDILKLKFEEPIAIE